MGVFLFHPYFLIKNISITGNQTIAGDEILNKVNQVVSKKRFWFLDGKNIFFVNTNQIKKDLEDKFVFENLKISTSLPQSLNVEVQEKEAKMILFTYFGSSTSTYNYFFLDETGKIIRQSDEKEFGLSTLPKVLIEKNDMELKLNEQVLVPANYEFIKFLEEKINNKNNIFIDHYSLTTRTEKTLNIQTGEGWKIVVDRQNDWNKQIQVLETILKDKIKDRKNLKYIDVRFENRSYFQ
ncbi:MAG: hypothetical protein NTU97_03400 [Candidatus Magasanikbacteria bacterium]|nr:hypothetical protein [Candidatus Magasanikbacteria bacterium]